MWLYNFKPATSSEQKMYFFSVNQIFNLQLYYLKEECRMKGNGNKNTHLPSSLVYGQ